MSLRVKHYTGVYADKDSKRYDTTTATFVNVLGFLKMFFSHKFNALLFSSFGAVAFLSRALVFNHPMDRNRDLMIGLAFVVVVILVVKLYPKYVKPISYDEWQDSKTSAISVSAVRKAYKGYYAKANMSDLEIAKSTGFTRAMINAMLDSGMYTTVARGSLYTEADGRQYEIVDVPDVVMLYHYNFDQTLNENVWDFDQGVVRLWVEPQLVQRAMSLQQQIDTALGMVGLKSVAVSGEPEQVSNEIHYGLEDTSYNDGFDFSGSDPVVKDVKYHG